MKRKTKIVIRNVIVIALILFFLFGGVLTALLTLFN
jgi:uncharacterized membrane protein YdfJ with MMPL/SSD domain